MRVCEKASFDILSGDELAAGGASWVADGAFEDAPEAQSNAGAIHRSNTGATGGVYVPVNRVHKHDLPKQRVAARLRRLGATVHAASAADPYDLIVNGDTRVTLRVAYPGLRRHRVTVGGRSYRYRYRTWHFNFHHHGRFSERYTDVFVCIAVNPDGRGQTFVIPWEKVSGKTFSLHGGRGTYNGRYAPFRDAWDSVLESAKRGGSLRRVA